MLIELRSRYGLVAAAALTCALGLGCGADASAKVVTLADAGKARDAGVDAESVSPWVEAPETLDAWPLFEDAIAQKPAARTFPYDVISPLFTDYAYKRRFLYLPEGKRLGYDAKARWRLPEGAVLIKTFSYLNDARYPSQGERLLETRLLVMTKAGLVPHTYVWDEAQTKAERKVAGKTLEVSWRDAQGTRQNHRYAVPNTNECHECHGKAEATAPLGLRTRQLDRDASHDPKLGNQIDDWQARGLLDAVPEPHFERTRLVDPFGAASLTDRARSYLDANCAHCHQRGGDGESSAMWLSWEDTAEGAPQSVWGVCKRPDSAGGATCGRQLDIVPGMPDASIYMCRLESSEPKVQMPPLGRGLVHAEGVTLLREFIAALPGSCE
jgi:uncharacterized repeat protein (TIGR03806 family)